MWGRKSELGGGRDVAKEGEAAKDAASSEGAEEVEESVLKEAGGDGESFEDCGDLSGVDLNETEEVVSTAGEGILPGGVVRGRLNDGCFESREDMTAEGCGYGVGGGGRM